MRSMTIQETKKANGGKTEYLQCRYCKKKFYYTYYEGFSYCYARGKAAINLRTHLYSCCLNYC